MLNQAVCQKGFSLIETLVSMLIASIAIAAVMSIHAKNLGQTHDNAALNQAQILMTNLTLRAQNEIHGASNVSPSQFTETIRAVKAQAADVGMPDADISIKPQQAGWLAQISWPAHVPTQAVVRSACVAPPAGHHCLALLLAP